MNRLMMLSAVTPLLIAAAPAMDSETKKDVRCFLSLSALAGSADKEDVTSIAIVAQYFLGRIDARAPTLDLEEAMATEARNITSEEISALGQSCSSAAAKRGKEIQEIGTRLQKRGI